MFIKYIFDIIYNIVYMGEIKIHRQFVGGNMGLGGITSGGGEVGGVRDYSSIPEDKSAYYEEKRLEYNESLNELKLLLYLHSYGLDDSEKTEFKDKLSSLLSSLEKIITDLEKADLSSGSLLTRDNQDLIDWGKNVLRSLSPASLDPKPFGLK